MARMKSNFPDMVMNGLAVTSIKFNQTQDMYNVLLANGEGRQIPCRREYDIDFSLSGTFEQAIDFSNGALLGNSLMALGDGRVCPYCTATWPPGLYVCYNCGGELGAHPFIEPVSWGLIVTEVNFLAPAHGLVSIEVCTSAGGVMPYPIKLQERLSWKSVPFGTDIDTGNRLCEWCGLATRNRGNCQGCGGPRTPLRELIDMHHECVWCGSDTINGIICEACGTRVGGRTIGELIDR